MNINVALIGLRGSGKTTLGHSLAKKLQCPLIDMDRELEFRKGMKIHEWVEKEGWEPFRTAEANLLEELTDSQGKVISTGGGVILDPGSRRLLKEKTLAFYLHWSPEILAERIEGDINRPQLEKDKSLIEEMQSLYAARDGYYRDCGSLIEHQGQEDPDHSLNLILASLEQETDS